MSESAAFTALESENARLKAALSDCRQGLDDMAMKLVVCGHLLGFSAEDPVEQIKAQVKIKLRIL